eukprot:scaffold1834_cov175-Amphora_coffeaeformis.AAC.9
MSGCFVTSRLVTLLGVQNRRERMPPTRGDPSVDCHETQQKSRTGTSKNHSTATFSFGSIFESMA